MAIIDPEGLFSGERLAACSDLAQFCWPRFFLAANSCGRIELSYKSLVSRVFGNFHKVPESQEIWAIFREYEANYLAVLYEAAEGSWWCQFITSEKYLPKYKKTRDELSPAPSVELMEKHRRGYLEWKRSKSFQNQSFQKLPELFSSEGVGIGVGVGEGIGIGVGEKHSRPNDQKEKAAISSIFDFYCETFSKNQKQYQLTDERKKKAGLRYKERLKANNGDHDAVVSEFAKCVENLAASDYHVSGGYIDWIEQIFRSQEEFEKRLNWKPNGNGGNHAAVPNGRAEGNLAVLAKSLSRAERKSSTDKNGLFSSGEDGRNNPRTIHGVLTPARPESVPSGDGKPFEF